MKNIMNRLSIANEKVSLKDSKDITYRKDHVCPICLTSLDSVLRVEYLDEEFKYLPKKDNPFSDLETFVCSNCGFGWVNRYIDQAQLNNFYSNVYRGLESVYSYQKPKLMMPKIRGFAPLDARFVSQILLAKMFKNFQEGEKVLDIGPGRGESFRTISQMISGMNYFAFEPDESSRAFLQRTGVYVFPYLFSLNLNINSIVRGCKFDLILMSHVLEHFNGRDIVAILENIRRILSEDGILICEVPNCDWRQYEKMRINDSPHLSFFTVDSLRSALIKAGFDVRFLNTCSADYNSWWDRSKSSIQSKHKYQVKPCMLDLIKRIYRILPIPVPKRIGTGSIFINVSRQSIQSISLG